MVRLLGVVLLVRLRRRRGQAPQGTRRWDEGSHRSICSTEGTPHLKVRVEGAMITNFVRVFTSE